MKPAPPPADGTLLEMRGVAVGAMLDPTRRVARDVNWAVTRGDFWVLAGLQGSGKSEYLMMTAGLAPALEGEFRWFGEGSPAFEPERVAQRLRVGLVFDGGQLLNNLTVFENVALPLRYHGNQSRTEAENLVRAWLDAVELTPWASNTPGTLPHAWRKRAGLARALVLHPEVLLLDAPLGGADLRQARWWLGFLGALSRGHALLDGRPLTLVVTADDFRPWRGVANRFAVLAQQRFTALGDWSQVEQSPDPIVRELLARRSGD